MPELTYRQAITAAMAEELRRDERVFVMGEDARADLWATSGLYAEFGDRIRDTPLSELGFTGAAIGAAMTGLRPIVDLQIAQLVYNAFEQIANQAAKSRYMYNGQVSVPIVIRAAMGYGGSSAAHHSDRPYPMLMNLPGIKIICPTTPADVKGMIKSAVRDPDPVIVFEDNNLMLQKGEVGGPEDVVPIGVGKLCRIGEDVTIVAIAGAVPRALEAADRLADEGISADVIDPRTLVPLDRDMILDSVRKTGRLVVADPANRTCGAAAEISAIVAEEAFAALRAPIRRVTAPDMVVPFSPALEAGFYPDADKIVAAAHSVVGGHDAEVFAGAH
ncbi:MAG: Transketolase central region [Pseudonocardiales bacterium]|nr:Transketolase central region [Pseudonocardiales bacterium]